LELTEDMLECMRIHFTIIDGWELSCTNCRIFNNDEVIRQNGICSVYNQCNKWVEQQNKSFGL
jgi:hypothetical protein